MTEIEYVLDRFDDHFSAMREKRLVLHGSRNYAEAILERFGPHYHFVGVMSMDPLEGTSWHGLPILREEDLETGKIDTVILTERVKYEEAAFRAIRRSCKKSEIDIFNMYGVDEFLIHYEASTAEPLTFEGTLQRCEPYDIVSFEVVDVIFPVTGGQVGRNMIPNRLFSELIPALRARGKELRFSLRKSFPEDEQIRALKEFGFLADECELIRRKGEDLSFRALKESAPGKKIVYIGSGLINEFFLPRCYGIDSIRFAERNVLDFDCLRPDHTAPARVPFSPGRREEIRGQIRRHSLISFDVFDTLLIRKTLYPRDVYALTEQRAKQAGYRAKGFAAARAGTEDSIPFCTLDQVYEELAEIYAWDTQTEAAMKALELQVERAVLVPRPELVELLEFALREGKRVVLTSDMYLPGTVLRGILEEKGVRGFEKIFVSCDYRQAKQGGLFSQLLTLGAEAGEILHIGDNPESDGNAPKALGIDSIVIPSPLDLAKSGPWLNALVIASSLPERCLLGLTVSRLFADPFENPNPWELPLLRRMALMGYGVVGPLIVGHMCWLIRALREKQYDGVLFLARDGWLPLKLYDRIRERLSLPPSFYFLANRHSSFLCCADNEQQADRMDELGKSFGLDTEQLLERVYMIPREKHLPRDYRELISEYIDRHMPLIREIAANARLGYHRYAEKLGMRADGNYAVVDFIAAGNTQKCMAKTLPCTLRGFYYGTYSSAKTDEKTIAYYLQGDNPTLLRSYVELESFFCSPEPSLDHMSEQGIPVFQEELRSAEEIRTLTVAWDAADAFAQEYFDLFYTEGEKISPTLVEEMYASEVYLGIELALIDDWFKTPLRKRSSEKEDHSRS